MACLAEPCSALPVGSRDSSLFTTDDDSCSICLEPFKNARATPCGHAFCLECIATTIGCTCKERITRMKHCTHYGPCPICRTTVFAAQLKPVAFPARPEHSEKVTMAKRKAAKGKQPMALNAQEFERQREERDLQTLACRSMSGQKRPPPSVLAALRSVGGGQQKKRTKRKPDAAEMGSSSGAAECSNRAVDGTPSEEISKEGEEQASKRRRDNRPYEGPVGFPELPPLIGKNGQEIPRRLSCHVCTQGQRSWRGAFPVPLACSTCPRIFCWRCLFHITKADTIEEAQAYVADNQGNWKCLVCRGGCACQDPELKHLPMIQRHKTAGWVGVNGGFTPAFKQPTRRRSLTSSLTPRGPCRASASTTPLTTSSRPLSATPQSPPPLPSECVPFPSLSPCAAVNESSAVEVTNDDVVEVTNDDVEVTNDDVVEVTNDDVLEVDVKHEPEVEAPRLSAKRRKSRRQSCTPPEVCDSLSPRSNQTSCRPQGKADAAPEVEVPDHGVQGPSTPETAANSKFALEVLQYPGLDPEMYRKWSGRIGGPSCLFLLAAGSKLPHGVKDLVKARLESLCATSIPANGVAASLSQPAFSAVNVVRHPDLTIDLRSEWVAKLVGEQCLKLLQEHESLPDGTRELLESRLNDLCMAGFAARIVLQTVGLPMSVYAKVVGRLTGFECLPLLAGGDDLPPGVYQLVEDHMDNFHLGAEA